MSTPSNKLEQSLLNLQYRDVLSQTDGESALLDLSQKTLTKKCRAAKGLENFIK